jgi:hypothetical protein
VYSFTLNTVLANQRWLTEGLFIYCQLKLQQAMRYSQPNVELVEVGGIFENLLF